jgi:hypothetical protein
MLRHRRQRVATGLATLLVVANHGPPITCPTAAQTGPCWMPWGAPVEPAADHGGAGVRQRGISAWACLPTTPTTLLCFLEPDTLGSEVRDVRERRGSCVGRPYAGGARRLTHHESPSINSGWVTVSFGDSSSERRTHLGWTPALR